MTGLEAIHRAEEMGLPMAQHAAEFVPCTEWLVQKLGRPARILEIGTQHGGTAAVWCELATQQMISVDMPFGIHGGLAEADMVKRNVQLSEKHPQFIGIIGNSQSEHTVAQVKKILGNSKLDLLFIDGDHRYPQAKIDYELYTPFVRSGGVVLFHDIDHTPFYDSLDVTVYRLWNELTGEKYEWSIHHSQWGGLGAQVMV